MRTTVLAMCLAGCNFVNPNYPPELPLDAELTDCEVDEDCTIVELGCCSDCNGGLAVAVRNDARDQVETDFSQACGRGVACTLIACAPLEATCEANVCAVTQGEFPDG